MSIQMIGIDHSTAPLAVREGFSFTKKRTAFALRWLMEQQAVNGAVLLSTCNRTELWLDCRDGEDVPVTAWFLNLAANREPDSADFLKLRQGTGAVEHLYRLCGGLCSMILGEDQILTQVKQALSLSREHNAVSTVLEVLFRMAVTAGKKVKTTVLPPQKGRSVVSHALHLLEKKKIPLRDARCLVIGNGEVGRAAAQGLRDAGADVTVTIRQYRSGMVLLPDGCRQILYGDRFDSLPQCDLVISATSSPNKTITLEQLDGLSLKHQLVILDLAVPRDIDPRIGNIDGVLLMNIDDYGSGSADPVTNAYITRVETVLQEEASAFFTWYGHKDITPRISKLAKAVSDDIAGRMYKPLKPFLPEQRKLLEHAVHNAAEKALGRLLFEYKDQVDQDILRQSLDAMEQVYREEER